MADDLDKPLPAPADIPRYPVRSPVLYEEDGISIKLSPEESKRLKAERYKLYLGPFFCMPMTNPAQRRILQNLFAKKEFFYSLLVPNSGNNLALRQTVQEYLLSFGTKKTWYWYSTQSLVENHFASEAKMSDLDAFDVLVIIHQGTEIVHSYNLDLTQQIVGYRTLNGKYTLFISPSESTVSKGMRAVNPFVEVGVSQATSLSALSGEAPRREPPKRDTHPYEYTEIDAPHPSRAEAPMHAPSPDPAPVSDQPPQDPPLDFIPTAPSLPSPRRRNKQ